MLKLYVKILAYMLTKFYLWCMVNLLNRAFKFLFPPKKEKAHWCDDWDKAKYTIRKHTNNNGYLNYEVYRTLHGKCERVSGVLGHENYQAALNKIESNKNFYRQQWNTRYTNKIEWIEVE